MGMEVAYHDPHVPFLQVDGTLLSCCDLEAGLAEADCVVIVTDHSAYDWSDIAARAGCVLDCRGVLRGARAPAVIRL
jgi:UDP-N-acetyl-D-glucosamine dehydrogenase